MGSERLVDACLLPGFAGAELPDWVRQALDGGLAGVTLYGHNLTDPEAVHRLAAHVHDCRPDALVALDEEGGDVTRLDYRAGSAYPGNLALGELDDEASTYAVATAIAADLRDAGVDVDLAPCIDVNSDPDNPVIGVRSFGASPERVARHGAAFVRGLQDGGVAAVVKHFPGHGATTVDSHLALPRVADTEEVLRVRDLPPFVAAVAAGALGVMTAHVVFETLDEQPATLSRRVLTGLLRDELGFDGVVVTDALDMAGVRAAHGIDGAAVLALVAGADLLVLGAEDGETHRADVHRAVAAAVADGRLTTDRLEDAAARVRTLAAHVAGNTTTGRPASDVGLEAARRAVRSFGALPLAGPAVVAELRGTTNLAVGDARWTLAGPLERLGALAAAVPVGPDGPAAHDVATTASGRPLVLAVRDARRSRWQREWVTAMLKLRPDVVLVALGMPEDAELGARTAVLAYGAGRVNTQAAAEHLVKGGSAPSGSP